MDLLQGLALAWYQLAITTIVRELRYISRAMATVRSLLVVDSPRIPKRCSVLSTAVHGVPILRMLTEGFSPAGLRQKY